MARAKVKQRGDDYRELVEGLKKANEELNKINQMKSDFISAVSHEIRTPLALIKEGVTQVLDGTLGSLAKDQERSLSIAWDSIDRLSKVVDSLLDISKLDAGRVELRRTHVDMPEVVEGVVEEFRRLAESKRISLKYNRPEENFEMFIDAENIRGVISNLLSNAFKFTKEGGEITVDLEDKGKHMIMSVKDTGIGIAKANVPKLFDKYSQFGQAPAGYKEKGTGLGLAIAKGVVEMHNGRIWAESALGKGSTFIFMIPRLSSETVFREYISYGIKEAINKESFLSIVVLRLEGYKELQKKLKSDETITILTGLEGDVRKILRSNTDIFLRDTCECVIVLFGADRSGVMVVKNKVIEAARRYIDQVQKKRKTILKISIGISTYPEEARTSEEMLFKARVRLIPMYTGPERRQYYRKICKIDARAVKEEKELMELETVDVSEGGVCIFTDSPVKKGSMHEFIFDLPRGLGTIKTKVKAIWAIKEEGRESYRTGFQFTEVSNEDLKKLRSFIYSGSRGE